MSNGARVYPLKFSDGQLRRETVAPAAQVTCYRGIRVDRGSDKPSEPAAIILWHDAARDSSGSSLRAFFVR